MMSIFHFFASSVAAGLACCGGEGSGGTPPSMQLLHLLSTHPSMSCSPLPPRCLPPHSRATIPAMTPTSVITAKTTTSVSIDRCVYRELVFESTTTTGGAPTCDCGRVPMNIYMCYLVKIYGLSSNLVLWDVICRKRSNENYEDDEITWDRKRAGL